jgi:hypothetical protein
LEQAKAPRLRHLLRGLIGVALGFTTSAPNNTSCTISSLSQALPDTAVILSADFVPSGGLNGEALANPAFPINPTDLPATCAVLINVTTSSTSSYRFGLCISTTTWNKRYLTVGNGGFSGGINWISMGAGVRYGFAVASTGIGHISPMLVITWALGQPREQLHSGFRATHGTTVLAKQLVESFFPCEY